jgi:serine/threonine protein kinase
VDLLLGTDLAPEPGQSPHVVLRAIRYERDPDPQRIQERRALVDVEAQVLTTPHPALPYPAGLLYVDHPEWTALDPALADAEPILVLRWIEGQTLAAWLHQHHPTGAPPEVSLPIVRTLAECLSTLHEHGWIHRALQPDHVLIDQEGQTRLVGLGNAHPEGARVSTTRDFFDPAFGAPEIERELSGRFVGPRADLYSLGALLGWLATGEAPTGNPDQPWTRTAIERMRTQPEGIGLLVAHCMQPLHKKRFPGMSRLLPWLHPGHLPTAAGGPFGEVSLTSPFTTTALQNAPVSRLTPGPLVERAATGAGAVTTHLAAVTERLPAPLETPGHPAPDLAPAPAAESAPAPLMPSWVRWGVSAGVIGLMVWAVLRQLTL